MKSFMLLLCLPLILFFQNCSSGGGAGQYSMLNQSSLVSAVDCSANTSSCLYGGTGAATLLQLHLDSWVVQNVSSTTPSITVTGTCVDGTFNRTRIYWEMINAAGQVLTTSLLQGLRSGCTQGTFSQVISGFTNTYGYANFTNGTQLQIVFTLNGINLQGSLVTAVPAAQATAAKQIAITL